jgi:hypothetical protein
MTSLGGGVDRVKQLKSAPEAVSVSEIRSSRLPVIGQRRTTPSER